MSLPVRLPLFSPDSIYLDTPTYGLASSTVIEVMTQSLDRWRRGIATMAEYDQAVVRSRELVSENCRGRSEPSNSREQASVFVGEVASSLPDGSDVLAPEGDFTSLLFPMLVQGRRGITLRTAPLEASQGSTRS